MLGRQYVSKGVCRCWLCCLQSDRGGWELIVSHGVGTVVCPITTVIRMGTKTCEMEDVFPPDDLWFGLDTYDSLYEYIYIYVCVCEFGSLMSDVTCNYVSADVGRDGRWLPALPGHWLSYTVCWQSLLVMYWFLCLGCCFYLQLPP